MSSSEATNTKSENNMKDEIQEAHLSLPKEKWFGFPICFYQGFWSPFTLTIQEVIAFQKHFEAHDTDIIVASLPKTGTTWLKSLTFTIVHRHYLSNISQHPLRTKNPHELVQHLEMQLYKSNPSPNLANEPSPRLFAIHFPYMSLPESIKHTKCKIVYICRNPLDTFISHYHFLLKSKGINELDMKMMEEHLDKYCNGTFPLGPYEDHLLGYWNESKQHPQKVLFLEYEGLKMDPKTHLKKLAEFVGCPFSEEEETKNVIDEIIELCSLKSLKEMEVNKNGRVFDSFKNDTFFRKGKIGDWTNYLTPSMAKRFDKVLDNLTKAGFSFAYHHLWSN